MVDVMEVDIVWCDWLISTCCWKYPHRLMLQQRSSLKTGEWTKMWEYSQQLLFPIWCLPLSLGRKVICQLAKRVIKIHTMQDNFLCFYAHRWQEVCYLIRTIPLMTSTSLYHLANTHNLSWMWFSSSPPGENCMLRNETGRHSRIESENVGPIPTSLAR